RQTDALEHSLAVGAQRQVRRVEQIESIEEAVDARLEAGSAPAVQTPVEPEQLAPREAVVKAEMLREKSDPPARLAIADRRPEDAAGSPGRVQQRQQQLDRRRLSRTVRAEKTEYLATPDCQRQVGDRKLRSEPLEEAARFDCRVRHASATARNRQSA